MTVKLIDHNKNMLETVKLATGKCYGSVPSAKAVDHCAINGHWSVLEHCWFSFEVTNVSRALLAQITRHRHLSFSVRSQRYCNDSSIPCIYPFPRNSKLYQSYEMALSMTRDVYSEMIEKGVPKEDARYILPNATCTTFVVSGNGRAWLEFLRKRLCHRAQWEIRRLAEEMHKLLMEVAPEIFQYADPCVECMETSCPKGVK